MGPHWKPASPASLRLTSRAHQSEQRCSPWHIQMGSTLPSAEGTATAPTLRYGWLSSSSLPTDSQRPARPQAPRAPSTVTSASVRGSDTRLESQPVTLYQTQPAGPTDNWLQNITASVCILVQGWGSFFLAPLRAELNSGPIMKVRFSFYSLQGQYQVVRMSFQRKGPKTSYPNK